MARYFVEYRGTSDAAFTAAPGARAAGVATGRTTADVVAPQPAAAASGRALGVDALRGLAILVMVLGQTKPYKVLPAWMYHAQEPPPTHAPNLHLAGLTFPDLIFPFFLFTLGVAIPLSLGGRLRRGASYPTVVRGAFTRGLLLIFLALFSHHFGVVPSLVQPERTGWIVALASFPVLFAIFTRLPHTWNRWTKALIRIAGWLGALALFALVRFPDGSGFDPNRIDVVLITAAVCIIVGTPTWLLTRGRLMPIRLVVMAVVAYFHPTYIQYLCVALPGTIVGDILASRLHPDSPRSVSGPASWSRTRVGALCVALVLFVPLLLVGVQSRYVNETLVATVALCGAALYLARRPVGGPEQVVSRLIWWGGGWLVLGLILDPIEGGTQKLPPTFAWMFQCVGLGVMLIAAFTLIIDVLRKRWLQLLIDNGHNPMIAYVGYATLVLPVIGLTGIKTAFEQQQAGPWVALAWGLLLTLAVAYVTRFFTRRKLFWRT